MFISFPRTSTVPVTLTKLFIKSKKRFPELLAFPALDFHEEGNCAGIQNADALAKIDGRLFVVDKKWKWCPSKIWIFDLYDRKLGSEVHEFPRFINYIKTVNMDFGSMALYENRIDIYAFILDRYNQAVVVFSMLKKKWKIVRLRGFNSVSGIAVSVRRYIYLSSMKSTTPGLYSLLTSSSYRLHMDRLDFLYFDWREMTALSSWHASKPFKEVLAYQDENQQSTDNERYYSRFTTDYDRKVWLMIRFDGGFKLLTSGPVQKFDVSYKEEDDY
ncbi:Hypothetical predicted protein [Cloeon dipterum]|uniref:Uncharacterized protein n=1 Tax=Cloeon dipterum TaxID=197152 RepID=A0A8S1DTT0_9INSE|nr:Hypothetical predicted protein [Cloeon dipterum]